MQFRTLKLSGFKSFVEATELEIAPGLTGIVGPNGCGKSNIVEALRWVMGETSAKRMRGGEMDDVIFSGSDNRPARNIAEVVLTVLNDGGQVPAIFEKMPELEIRRRIERGEGSDYKVNGRPVRARDVQLLFADAAIGASSPAMVSQGRISALIAAKPSERRFILEDAAGIGGLQSRRHEAELKLKAAETNLTQLESVLETLRAQENALKRQARQAEKYRHVAERIREIEAILLYCAWTEAQVRQTVARQGFDDSETAVRAAMADMASAASRESVADAAIVSARLAEREAQSDLRTLTQREQALHAEQQRLDSSRVQAERDRAQGENDLAHQGREHAEAEDAGLRLDAERRELANRQPAIARDLEQSEDSERRELDSLRVLEDRVLAASAAIARGEAHQTALNRQLGESYARRDQMAEKLDAAEKSLATVAIEKSDDLQRLEAVSANARITLETAQAAITPARTERERADIQATAAREQADLARAAETRLKAEIAGVEAGLSTQGETLRTNPALNAIAARPGYEQSLAAALGEDAQADLDPQAAYKWVALSQGALSAPKGTAPLAASIDIPLALRRAVSGIGVATAEEAAALHDKLLPGQAIVTREGALYRWDGLVRAAGSRDANPVAATLARRNRLEELRSGLEKNERDAVSATVNRNNARQAADAAGEGERSAITAMADAANRLHRADSALAAARQRGEQAARLLEQARMDVTAATQRVEETAAAHEALVRQRAELPDLAAGREDLAAAQQSLLAGRDKHAAISAGTRDLRQAQERAGLRLAAIADEAKAWQDRARTRAQRLAEIGQRIEQAQRILSSFGERPADIKREIATVMDRIADAEQTCRLSGDAVIRAEAELGDRRRDGRQCEQRLSAAREDRARAEVGLQTAIQATSDGEARIVETLHLSVEELARTIESDGSAPDRGDLEERLAASSREREAIGPVNLRAEIELQEATREIDRIEAERADLVEAIGKLRQAIAKLNREARERLTAAFESVRVHFKRLFSTLFGGGEAELTLTNLDDPLEAGLEIFASPPGKKLQILSLLSGGEQALTALALLFAMFLSTPAPVCVLDEVDAPLDDANVTRFCDLLDDIAAQTGTRFLVITHHRVTMARMDRLYGVTMAERGISMLVSVDLRAAESLVEPFEEQETPRFAGFGRAG